MLQILNYNCVFKKVITASAFQNGNLNLQCFSLECPLVWFLIKLYVVYSLSKSALNILPIQLLAFLQGLFTFYHEGYELAHEFEPYKQQLQFNLQNVSLHTSGVVHKGIQPRNQILQLIIPRHNKLSSHKWIAVWWNGILCCTEDQYFQNAVLLVVTAGYLMVMCQKKGNIWKSADMPLSPLTMASPLVA